MKKVLILLVFLCSVAFGKDKKLTNIDYKDAILVSFHTSSTGSSCSGSVDAKEDENGNVNGNTQSNCSDIQRRFYVISVGDQKFTITPAGHPKSAMASLGYSELFRKGSVLRDQLPGTHILIRSDPHGMYVKVGDKESKFEIVEAK